MNTDDPKLTAFALDELDEPERSAVASEVAQSPDAQRVVDETRDLARALKTEFASEMTREAAPPRSDGFPAVDYRKRRPGGRRSLMDIHDDPWFWGIGRPLAIAAMLAVFAVIAGVS